MTAHAIRLCSPKGRTLKSSTLGFRNISRDRFRSSAVILCAMLVAGLALAAVLIVRGAGDSLDLAESRFGADLVVVPEGAERETKGALLMTVPMNAWMPSSTVGQVGAIAGVETASPQLYLATAQEPQEVELMGMDPQGAQPFFPSASTFLVAYDPTSDFTIAPWLPEGTANSLSTGQSFAGSLLSVPADADRISLFRIGPRCESQVAAQRHLARRLAFHLPGHRRADTGDERPRRCAGVCHAHRQRLLDPWSRYPRRRTPTKWRNR